MPERVTGRGGWMTVFVVTGQCEGIEMTEEIRAEMVASVLEVVVHQGDAVRDGDTIVVLESMKMEIPVLSESPGTVTTLAVHQGDVVQEGTLIAVVE
jgi:biotin carboxyl carrier protein